MTLGCRIVLTSNLALFRRHGFVVVGHETHAGFSAPTSYDMELRARSERRLLLQEHVVRRVGRAVERAGLLARDPRAGRPAC